MNIDDLRQKANELRLGITQPPPGPQDPASPAPAAPSGIATLIRQLLPLVVEAVLLRRDQAASAAPQPQHGPTPPPGAPPRRRSRWKSAARTALITACAGLAGYLFWRLDAWTRLRRVFVAKPGTPAG